MNNCDTRQRPRPDGCHKRWRGSGEKTFAAGRAPTSASGWHPEKENHMNGIWIFIAILVVWVILQTYVLPKMGIST
jgi:hypothetical protein